MPLISHWLSLILIILWLRSATPYTYAAIIDDIGFSLSLLRWYAIAIDIAIRHDWYWLQSLLFIRLHYCHIDSCHELIRHWYTYTVSHTEGWYMGWYIDNNSHWLRLLMYHTLLATSFSLLSLLLFSTIFRRCHYHCNRPAGHYADVIGHTITAFTAADYAVYYATPHIRIDFFIRFSPLAVIYFLFIFIAVIATPGCHTIRHSPPPLITATYWRYLLAIRYYYYAITFRYAIFMPLRFAITPLLHAAAILYCIDITQYYWYWYYAIIAIVTTPAISTPLMANITLT